MFLVFEFLHKVTLHCHSLYTKELFLFFRYISLSQGVIWEIKHVFVWCWFICLCSWLSVYYVIQNYKAIVLRSGVNTVQDLFILDASRLIKLNIKSIQFNSIDDEYEFVEALYEFINGSNIDLTVLKEKVFIPLLLNDKTTIPLFENDPGINFYNEISSIYVDNSNYYFEDQVS